MLVTPLQKGLISTHRRVGIHIFIIELRKLNYGWRRFGIIELMYLTLWKLLLSTYLYILLPGQATLI